MYFFIIESKFSHSVVPEIMHYVYCYLELQVDKEKKNNSFFFLFYIFLISNSAF